MARDIKDTPVLKGKDAVRFLAQIEKNKTKKIDKEALARIYENARIIEALIKK